MFSIINRAVAREISVYFGLALLILTFVLILQSLFAVIEQVVRAGVSLADFGRLLLYILPPFIAYALPLALLIGVLLCMSRLSSDGELIAMKGAGMGLQSLLPPILTLATAAMLLTAVLTMAVEPWGRKALRRLIYDLSTRVQVAFKPRVFSEFSGLVVYVDEAQPDSGIYRGVLIYDEKISERPVTIFAEEGKILPEPENSHMILDLRNGAIHFSPSDSLRLSNPRRYEKILFDRYRLRVDLSQYMKAGNHANLKVDDMTVGELQKSIRALRSGNIPKGLAVKDIPKIQVVLHKKLAFPVSCVIFGILAIPLGIQPIRSSRIYGYVISIIALLSYYLLLTGGEFLGRGGVVPPMVAIWTPNLIMLVLGLVLFRRAQAETPFGPNVWLGRLVDRVRATRT